MSGLFDEVLKALYGGTWCPSCGREKINSYLDKVRIDMVLRCDLVQPIREEAKVSSLADRLVGVQMNTTASYFVRI